MKLYHASFSRFRLKIKRYTNLKKTAIVTHDISLGFMTRVTRRVPLMYQELLTITVHMASSSVFVSIHVVHVV